MSLSPEDILDLAVGSTDDETIAVFFLGLLSPTQSLDNKDYHIKTQSLLIWVVKRGNESITIELHKQGVDINAYDPESGDYVLQNATKKLHCPCSIIHRKCGECVKNKQVRSIPSP